MSEQVQSIVRAVRALSAEERRELSVALAELGVQEHRLPGPKESVEAIRGKYRHVPTSSEEFMERKRRDLDLETRS